jgi:hypothetical protein
MQISLTVEERRALEAESARTGKSLSALIREAVEAMYGPSRSSADDLETHAPFLRPVETR